MSYPPPRYHGNLGQATAWVNLGSAPPELRNPSGGTAQYLATGAATEGKFGLYRWDMAPAPSGPGPHFHRTMAESFFVLSGAVRFYDGTKWFDAAPGDFLYVPEGGIHGFRNESGERASMLILFVPGASREEYFEVLADPARRDAMDDQQRTDFYLRHDTYWV